MLKCCSIKQELKSLACLIRFIFRNTHFFSLLFVVDILECNGKLAIASDRTRTQLYTAAICIADLSVTFFPLTLVPKKKL